MMMMVMVVVCFSLYGGCGIGGGTCNHRENIDDTRQKFLNPTVPNRVSANDSG